MKRRDPQLAFAKPGAIPRDQFAQISRATGVSRSMVQAWAAGTRYVAEKHRAAVAAALSARQAQIFRFVDRRHRDHDRRPPSETTLDELFNAIEGFTGCPFGRAQI